MVYGAKVAICSEINTKHINTVWAECKILECLTCWCITWPVGFKRLINHNNNETCFTQTWSSAGQLVSLEVQILIIVALNELTADTSISQFILYMLLVILLLLTETLVKMWHISYNVKIRINTRECNIIIVFPEEPLQFVMKCGVQDESVDKYKLCSSISVFSGKHRPKFIYIWRVLE